MTRAQLFGVRLLLCCLFLPMWLLTLAMSGATAFMAWLCGVEAMLEQRDRWQRR